MYKRLQGKKYFKTYSAEDGGCNGIPVQNMISCIKPSNHYSTFTKLCSFSSIQGIPSLLAAMETDPEDVLRSLGFDQDTFASPIYRIPVRFLQNASEAKGIDTQKFYHQALEMEDKVSSFEAEESSCEM